jgi:glutamine---fructose-6-phosphate transaminase (isomerizing)
VKEVSYAHLEGLAAGELKHGTLALVEAGTPCIVFSPSDETWKQTLSAIREVKLRGAVVAGDLGGAR